MDHAKALRQVIGAVLEAIGAAGTLGAPGGTLYAALMAHGASFSQYTSLMGVLVRSELVTRSGELYFLTDKGRGFVA